MIEVLKILRDSSIKVDNINESDISSNLYKKCSYRKNDNFKNIFNIKYKNYEFEIWGKNKGKENQINNFNFTKYFSCKIYGDCLILQKNNNYINFDLLIWQKLFQEEIINIESSSEDEDEDEDEVELNSVELNEESFLYTSEEDTNN